MGTTTSSPVPWALPAVHPHARGDNRLRIWRRDTGFGSPPRAWGQRLRGRPVSASARFTPTRVGTTPDGSILQVIGTVHPHARGDNIRIESLARQYRGSPPRAWGQRVILLFRVYRNRFTPTRVGTTPRRSARAAWRAVHPHARGDNDEERAAVGPENGSPPRAWGQRGIIGSQPRCRRFTPTRVGTTGTDRRASPAYPVHPHARGDNLTITAGTAAYTGSPPRAWGQPDDHRRHRRVYRFTPTRVGTTSIRSLRIGARSVHPHARGDNGLTPGVPEYLHGSPPRAWGQHSLLDNSAGCWRFTPTRVGTTWPNRPISFPSSVHPHARGDNGG